jgi:hypothetical protein
MVMDFAKDGADEPGWIEWNNEIFGDTMAHQRAVDIDVVGGAQQDQVGTGVADLGQRIGQRHRIISVIGFDHDQRRRHLGRVTGDRLGESALDEARDRLAQPVVRERPLDPCSGFLGADEAVGVHPQHDILSMASTA